MMFTTIDTFYLTDEELNNSPSRKDGIDEDTEFKLRLYGCNIIQECGILLKLPQQVMASGQVLFHRFYCKKSFAKFNVKRVAACCVWVASRLEENPRKLEDVINVFYRIICCKKYNAELIKKKLIITERHLLKELGFVCHVEHPHKFISIYLAILETPIELRQEAWNLANDSLRTSLCVRFKSEVVACGVVYAVARRFRVPLPENPPWWKAFDADKSGIDEVCRVLARLYNLPKAHYIPLVEQGESWDSQPQPMSEKDSLSGGLPTKDNSDQTAATTVSISSGESINEDIVKAQDRKRGRGDGERDIEKIKDRTHRSKYKGRDSGHSGLKHHSSRDRDHHRSYSSISEKYRHRNHFYG